MTRARVLGVPTVVLIALAALVAIGAILHRLASGREIYAIGSNPDGAALIGTRTTVLVLLRIRVGGLARGISTGRFGPRAMRRLTLASPWVSELTVIASVVVGGVAIRGGTGSVLGVALGTLTLLVIQNGLDAGAG